MHTTRVLMYVCIHMQQPFLHMYACKCKHLCVCTTVLVAVGAFTLVILSYSPCSETIGLKYPGDFMILFLEKKRPSSLDKRFKVKTISSYFWLSILIMHTCDEETAPTSTSAYSHMKPWLPDFVQILVPSCPGFPRYKFSWFTSAPYMWYQKVTHVGPEVLNV